MTPEKRRARLGDPETLSSFELSGMALEIDGLLALIETHFSHEVADAEDPPASAYQMGLEQVVVAARQKAKYLFSALYSIETYGARPAGGEQ